MKMLLVPESEVGLVRHLPNGGKVSREMVEDATTAFLTEHFAKKNGTPKYAAHAAQEHSMYWEREMVAALKALGLEVEEE